jgi:hypothetical protein
MPSPQKTAKSRQPFMPAAPRTRAATLRDLQALCAEEDPANVAKLVALRDDPNTPPVVQLGAVTAMFDRAHGKPAQTVNTRIIRQIGDLSDEELQSIISSGDAELHEEEGTPH